MNHPNPIYQDGVKIFLKYFISIWILSVLTSIVITFGEINPETHSTAYKIVMYTNSLITISILFGFFKVYNTKYQFIKAESINFSVINVVIGVCFGIAIGGIFPYIINMGFYADPSSFYFEFTKLGIENIQFYFDYLTSVDLFLLGILNTLIFPVIRAIFFFGILYPLFLKEGNITRATIQVTLFFVLANLLFQMNQLDIISLFAYSIVSAFVYFRTGSIVMVSLIAVFYDLPIYVYSMFDDFLTHTENYIVPNMDSVPFIAIWFVIGLLGVSVFRMAYRKVENE